MVLQVHDEILCELPVGKKDGPALAKKVKEAMESVGKDWIKDVPVLCDVARSMKSWGACEEVTL